MHPNAAPHLPWPGTAVPPTLCFGSGSALWGAGRHFGTPEEIGLHPEKRVHPRDAAATEGGGGQLIPLSAAAPERRPCLAITSRVLYKD